MALISRRWRGGRIYNNTRTRELLRRKCVKPADLTTHSPLKISARPRTAQALPEHFRSPTQPRPTPAGCAMHSSPTPQLIPRRRPSLAPAQRHALSEHFRSPTRRRRTPAGCAMHSSPTSQPISRRRPPLAPSIFSRPSRALLITPAAQTHTRRLRDTFPAEGRRPFPAAPPCLPLRSASGTKKRHRTVDVRCRMSRSTVVAVGHWG